MIKIIALIIAILLIPLYLRAEPAHLELIPYRFSYEGHIYFNATNAAIQGERFLLNQQLSNIKLGSELQISDWNKTKALLIYNTLPTPINPQVYIEQLYNEFKKPNLNWYFDVGKKWLPFGNYKNDLIYKPLTKALGQTNELTAVMVSFSTLIDPLCHQLIDPVHHQLMDPPNHQLIDPVGHHLKDPSLSNFG